MSRPMAHTLSMPAPPILLIDVLIGSGFPTWPYCCVTGFSPYHAKSLSTVLDTYAAIIVVEHSTEDVVPLNRATPRSAY